ncbi:MAG TPA: hypothetical protein VH834_11070 [Solirubrobacteraceae bacterium]|jgi:hypothetical protein
MRLVPQASLYEATIENAELEQALEDRERQRNAVAASRKRFREIDDRTKLLVADLDLGDDAPVRVGRFLITRTAVAARSVAFDTEPTTRLTIRTLEDAP